MKKGNQIYWLRLVASLLVLIAFSFGLAYLMRRIGTRLLLPLNEFAPLAYLSIFTTTLVCNLTVIVPVPVATSIMIAAATTWNPVMVALAASIGGALGELSGYYAGYLGKRVAISEQMGAYNKVVNWMNRYGLWAIFFLAIQPVIPCNPWASQMRWTIE